MMSGWENWILAMLTFIEAAVLIAAFMVYWDARKRRIQAEKELEITIKKFKEQYGIRS